MASDITQPVDEIAKLLRRHRLPFGTEKRLQLAVQRVLIAGRPPGTNLWREMRFDDRNIIDFCTDEGIGIECKVSGSPSQVLGQLTRYAEFDEISGLVLVTCRHTHRFAATEILGKPFRVVWVGGNL